MARTSLFVALLLGAACGALGAWALTCGKTDASGEAVGRQGPGAPGAPDLAMLDASDTQPAPAGDPTLVGAPEAAANLELLETRKQELLALVTELTGQVQALEPEPRDPRILRFGLTGKTPNFDAADWPELAGHVLEMAELLKDVRSEVLDEGKPSPGTIGRAMKHNQPLAVFAVSIHSEMGGANANVAYTHPAVIANLIRAALTEAGNPLTGGQELAIASLGEAWDQEQAARLFPASALELSKLLHEVDAKLAFLDQVKDVLTPTQRALLFQPETEGRLQIDILSPALVYVMRQPIGGVDPDDLALNLLKALFEHAGLSEDDLPTYAFVTGPWLDGVPNVRTPVSRRSEDIIFPHVNRMQAQARAQVRAMERILGTGRLDEQQAAGLRSVTWVLQPFVQLQAAPAPQPGPGSDPDDAD